MAKGMMFLGEKELERNLEPITRRRLERGDHIATDGSIGLYQHHGIYLGEDKGVADVSSSTDRKRDARPRRKGLDTFVDHGRKDLYRVNYHKEPCFSKDRAARNAEFFADNPSHWGEYSLVSNNCEDFANICKTGTPYSEQVEDKFVGLAVTPYAFAKGMVTDPGETLDDCIAIGRNWKDAMKKKVFKS